MSRPSPEIDTEQLAVLERGLRILALGSLGDTDLAEEVVQESLTRALAAIRNGRLRDPTQLGPFVHGIARHVIVDELRRRGRFAELNSEVVEAADPDTLDLLVRDEEHHAIRRALRELSETDQTIIRLSYVEGLTPAEVAVRCNEPAERVRKRKSRALERLRQVFLAARGGHDSVRAPTLLKSARSSAGGANGADMKTSRIVNDD